MSLSLKLSVFVKVIQILSCFVHKYEICTSYVLVAVSPSIEQFHLFFLLSEVKVIGHYTYSVI